MHELLKLAAPEEQARYPTAGTYQKLRSLGASFILGEKSSILFAYHLNYIDHWAACELRRAENSYVEISFGDSLDCAPPERVRSALSAWMVLLGLAVRQSDRVPILAHGRQDDTISCGIACVNTIEHAAFGVPLFRAARRDIFRITKFVELLEFHHRQETLSLLPFEFWSSSAELMDVSGDSPLPSQKVDAPIGPHEALPPIKVAPLAPPKALKQATLSFQPLSAEEKRLKREREQRLAAERREQRERERENFLWQKAQANEEKALLQRIETKLRVRKSRENKRQKEVLQGLRPAVGRKPVRNMPCFTIQSSQVAAHKTVKAIYHD